MEPPLVLGSLVSVKAFVYGRCLQCPFTKRTRLPGSRRGLREEDMLVQQTSGGHVSLPPHGGSCGEKGEYTGDKPDTVCDVPSSILRMQPEEDIRDAYIPCGRPRT
jgi:hypothetical protein